MDAEMKASSVEIPSLANVLTFKPGAGQNIASSFFHASSTARNTFFHPCSSKFSLLSLFSCLIFSPLSFSKEQIRLLLGVLGY